MSEMDMEMRCLKRCETVLRAHGIDYRPAKMVLFAMALEGKGYREAVEAWAEFVGWWDPTRWHAEICYRFLKAGIDEHPERMFEKWKKEVCWGAD